MEDEVKIPGLTVHQLIAQEDITAKVGEGIGDGDDDVTVAKKREANIEKITEGDADAAHPGHMHQVVALYQGAVYQLYRYRVWDDLRLVVAPHLQTAHFGGDPDNFTYPRWSIDFSFVRAYVDDKPADTSAHYFRWRKQGALDGDLVFVPGNPGNTNRQMTVSQLLVQRDVEYPMTLEVLDTADPRSSARSRTGRAAADDSCSSWQNSHKAIRGMLERPARRSELMDAQEVRRTRGTSARRSRTTRSWPRSTASIWREIDALTEKPARGAAEGDVLLAELLARDRARTRHRALARRDGYRRGTRRRARTGARHAGRRQSA